MSDGAYFHFNLGPVQGFVAQARRTRDFWAGSFLLSYMAAVAMKTVTKQDGEIVFPTRPDHFMDALSGDNPVGPVQGGVPNRFTARVPDSFDPRAVTHGVHTVWQQLADHVWTRDGLAELDADGRARTIWDEQIQQFWDMSWVITEGEDHSALDRRKNWRTHYPPAQGGAKCMIMDGWREFSGQPMRPVDGRREFWNTLRAGHATGLATDLEEGEMLCAIAYVKRRFARHFQDFSGYDGNQKFHGWRVPTAVPSVAFIAATPWLGDVIRSSEGEALWDFHNKAHALILEYGEWQSDLRLVRDALATRGEDARRRWAALDGSLFFPSTYDNENRLPGVQEKRRQAKDALLALRGETVPSPFYAALALDGDRLGEMLQTHGHTELTQALGAFNERVPDIVDRHSGFLVYAGGDDVLALLPLDTALACAADLRQAYTKSFQKHGMDQASISAGVLFAHFHTPLGRVLGAAHVLLDEVAKQQTQRDALAVQVRKPSGVACTWSKPWAQALADTDVGADAVVRIQDTAGRLAEREAETPFSSKFFYRIREQIEVPAEQDTALDFDDRVALMASRYLASGINANRRDKLGMAQATAEIAPLMELARTQRDPHGASASADPIHADAALLIRFLAAKGLGREHGT